MVKLEDELANIQGLEAEKNEAGISECYYHIMGECHNYCEGFKSGCEDYETVKGRRASIEGELRQNAIQDKRKREKPLNSQDTLDNTSGGYESETAESPEIHT